MNQEIIHLYFMPGMAANPTIFEHIKLPENQFKIHWLDWMIPEKGESLSRELCTTYEKLLLHDNVVIVRCFFWRNLGSRNELNTMTFKKIFVVSSVKSKHELAKTHEIGDDLLRHIKYLPTHLVKNVDSSSQICFWRNYRLSV